MLQRGDRTPHFEVTSLDGRTVRYRDLWQQRNLVLVTLAGLDDDEGYGAALAARTDDFRALETACVVTRDAVPGAPAPGALVADRWGEIVSVWTAAHVSDLPAADDLLDWSEHLEHRCPECEGEAR